MGKKNEKKVKGAVKTAIKTEKKADKKTLKLLKEKGEENIEDIIASIQEQDRKKAKVTEEKCPQPSPRSNMTLTPHPDKDELLMFGGEYFNGSKTFVYNDLFVYNVKSNDWSKISSPGAPPPRSAHQAVALSQGGGQLWIFGGEFTSQSQSQFYHYRDLWVFRLRDKTWEKLASPGGPSARSGHRMVACHKLLIVFGGFHDNLRDYKYYNDVHAFNLETYVWTKITSSGVEPAPRSGCVMSTCQDQKSIIIYGGYSKERVKKDVDRGKVHTDMFRLSLEVARDEKEASAASRPPSVKWKWLPIKQSGCRPSPRCSCPLATLAQGNRAVVFGGVFDEEEDDEDVVGKFYNDMFLLELDKGKWHMVELRGKRDKQEKKKRRGAKEADSATTPGAEQGMECEGDGDDESDGDGDQEETAEEVSTTHPLGDASQTLTDEPLVSSKENPGISHNVGISPEDAIFTLTFGPASTIPGSGGSAHGVEGSGGVGSGALMPGPRMNALLAVSGNTLFLYGGMCEEGERERTLSDMYSIDLRRLDEWRVLVKPEDNAQEWVESEDSSDDDDDDESCDDDDDDDVMEGGAKGGAEKMDDNGHEEQVDEDMEKSA